MGNEVGIHAIGVIFVINQEALCVCTLNELGVAIESCFLSL